MTVFVIVLGTLLGVLSRVEETTAGLSVGLSSDATWLAVAFAVGAVRPFVRRVRAARDGALALTAANAAYYAWIGTTEPGIELASVAGSPVAWLVLGVAGGVVLASAGRVWSATQGVVRVLASLPLAGVCIADGITAVLGGPVTDGVAMVLGVALPVLSATSPGARVLGAVLSAAVVGVALTGRLEPLLP